MDASIALFAAGTGYLIGSISFARVLGRWLAPGERFRTTTIAWGDDRGFEVENVSATTIAKRRGPAYGCLTALLDILKATIPVLVFRMLYPQGSYHVICAAAVIAGHNLPIYYGFKGGRGTSTLMGSLLVLDPLSMPVTIFLGYVIGLFVFKDVLLAHHAGWILILPFWFALRGRWDLVIFSLIVNLLRWSVSLPEIRTYLAYRRSGEFKTREFHEAIEQTHIGFIHKLLRRRGWIKYDYMETNAT